MEQRVNAANKFCFAWYEASQADLLSKGKAALLRESKWNAGDIITVSFIDGNEAIWDQVERAALGWTAPNLANLTFEFRRDTTETDIRISFLYAGSWSVIGTTCRNIKDLKRPTMNYGWLNLNSTQSEIDRVVLHEFGHALGLIHEHQHPENDIKWDKQAVYAALSGPPNNWTKQQIDFNLFEAYNKKESNFSAFDPHSIMMYPFPTTWTKDGFSTSLNSGLSATDKTFIHTQYS